MKLKLLQIKILHATFTHTHTHTHTPVGLRGEDSDHGWSLVDLQHVGERLKDVEVEEGVSRNRTVQTGLDTHTQLLTPP